MTTLEKAITTIGQLIDLSEKKIGLLCELRCGLAVAHHSGLDPKSIEKMTRSEKDLPRNACPSRMFWPYKTPWEDMITRVRAKGAQEWTTLPVFIDRKTGLPVEERTRSARRVPRSMP